MEIEVRAASVGEKPALASLLELYSYDFTDFAEMDVGEDGRFGYRYLDGYWTEDDASLS